MPIKEGELIRYDPLEEEIEVRLIEDEEERENTPTAGYFAMFEYTNGFKKTLYWSKAKMLSHADRYSQAFSLNGTTGRNAKVSYADYLAGKYPPKDEWLYSSLWYKDFDGMAIKTMLRQIISKWGIMSIDMQKAIETDAAVIREDMTPEYVEEEPYARTAEVEAESTQPADPEPEPAAVQQVTVSQPAAEKLNESGSLEDEFFAGK